MNASIYFLFSLMLLCAGCSVHSVNPSKHSSGKSEIYLKKGMNVFVYPPTLDTTLENKLGLIQWNTEKYTAELEKEIHFTLSNQKIAVVKDSTRAHAFIRVHRYNPLDITSPSSLDGYAILNDSVSQKRFEIPRHLYKQNPFENEILVIGHIRDFAGSLVQRLSQPPRKTKDKHVYKPQVWMMF
ncbi:MAG: hypothetical protein HQK83_10205 [Fibrobacteria bacterium]|nr:hypothetical protein [Fibrobacteria bacterium]